jgi:putative hydrolase of the HAD superfamily
LDHPPELLPGVREGLRFLAERASLALISDTASSPGIVLRELMMEQGIDHHFSTYIFSDETGVAKPHPDAFSTALTRLNATPSEAFHIGDIERTDIRGARGVGMHAVLYKGDAVGHKYAEAETEADVVMHHWSEIEDIWRAIESLETPVIDPEPTDNASLAKAA